MKPIYSAIVASVVFASLTVPALQSRADDDVRSGAWLAGHADGQACVANGANCKFVNPYLPKADESDEASEDADSESSSESQALNSADYIAGFIVGKSEANK